MKSVVVEASTVAKAIETAWLKADKPEEFFIRILQEHSSGFLGFGAQKAKVVFFFKNSHKSDSLFPVVVKQKEYANFFGNSNLKVPAELNVVDHELNKSVSLGGQHKKKPHNNQNNHNSQHKAKQAEVAKRDQSNPQSDLRSHVSNNASHTKVAVHKISQERAVDTAMHTDKQINKQVKIEHNAPKQLSQDKALANEAAVNKVLQSAPHKMQVSLQAPSFDKSSQSLHPDFAQGFVGHGKVMVDKPAAKKVVEPKMPVHKSVHKEDVVKDVANALKKIQSQKIVANVSSPKKTAHKQVTAKFESYEEFINSTTGIPAEKESVAIKTEKIEVVESLHKFLDHDTSVMSTVNDVITPREEVVAPVITQPSKPAATTPRAPLKFKRRPLTTENTGVSGIVRSVKTVESVEKTMDTAVEDVHNLDEKK
ncbi:MAG: Jag N-terminal domain-containing protein [Candidatus Chromulinivorax sp.]|nr:Jag N-terminal domain-containing protein [Candidatus Chromulinivorax sp.]